MFGTDTFVGSFAQEINWYQGVVVEISAVGQIGSGVLCTGLTPPGGWSEGNVSGDPNWPFHGDRARPYSLIGTLNRAVDFFFVGTGKSFALTSTGSTIPPHDGPEPEPPPIPPDGWIPPTRTLALLVNRPQANIPQSGDHEWDVTITVIEPDWNAATNTWDSPEACSLLTATLGDAQGSQAADACSDFTAAVRAVNDRWTLIAIAGGVAGGALIALVTVAVAVFTAAAAARVAQQNALSGLLNGIITAFITNPAASLTPLTALMQSPIAIGTTGMTMDTLWAIATSVTSPLAENPWMAILIGSLIVLLAIAVAVAIGLLLSLLTLAADVDNDKSNFDALVDNVQSLMDTLTDLGCAAPASTMLPTCPAIG